MITITADGDDRSSAQIELLDYHSCDRTFQPSTRNRWRRVFLVLHAYEVLSSLVDNARSKQSLTVPGAASDEDEAPSYTDLPTHSHELDAVTGNSANDQLDIRLDIHHHTNNDKVDEDNNNNNDIFGSTNRNNDGDDIVPLVPTRISMETLSHIVKDKNLGSLCELGGVEGIAAAVDTNLEYGICSTDAVTGNSANDQLDIRLDIHHNTNNDNVDEDNNNNNDIFGSTNSNSDGDDIVPLLPTTISMETLSRVVKDKNLGSLCELGGVEGIAAAVVTNLEYGICSTEELHRRQEEYGSNTYCTEPLSRSKSFLHSVIKAFKDWTVILLLCCAALSLASGILEEGLKNGWYDGTTLFAAVFILVAATVIKSCWRSCKSLKLLLNKNKPVINVLRQGEKQQISYSDVVVGDIVYLNRGDWVPADGLIINSENMRLDDGVLQFDSRINRVENPFLYYGAKVIEGSGHMLVTSVGMNTVLGEMMRTVNHGTPRKKQTRQLQVQLDKLNNYLQNIGLSLAILILITLLLRYFQGKRDYETGYPDQISKRTSVGELLIVVKRLLTKPTGMGTSLTTMLAVLLVGIQEGLPLIITLSLFYWNEKMVSDHQVRILDSSGCVSMGSVTTLFVDKTALNQMEVEMFWVGEEAISGNNVAVLSEHVLEMICDGVGTLVLMSETSTSPIEDPLLPWAELSLGIDRELLKQSRTVLEVKPFGPDMKRSGLLMRKNGDAETTTHLHWRGCAETILAMCSYYYSSDGIKNAMDEAKRAAFNEVVKDMATKGLNSIAFAYRPIIEEDDNGDNERVMITNQLHEDNLSLLVLFGLKCTCSPQARREAVDAFRQAGVSIKLVSPENLCVLAPIADECGILAPDQNAIVLEGEQFRNFSEAEMREKADKITVMGSSLPSDKLLLVQWLRREGQVVAVTGARTIDAPALKEADVGILIGTHISEMAKESSDIVILNGNFASLVNVTLFGRCAYQNIRKFIQLELTKHISGLLITFVTTVSLGDTAIAPLHLFLVNLMVGTLAALALLTEPPTQELLDVVPINQTEPLITNSMWRNILVQVFYQSVVLLIFQFKGQAILGMNRKVKKAMIFNGFVLCLVSNQFNAREPMKKNVFKGIISNRWFLVSAGGPIVLQVVVMKFATSFTDFPRLNGLQWLVCISFAIMSWPIDYVAKCIPAGFFTNRSIGSVWLRFTTPIPPIPMIIPTLPMRE